MAQASRTRRRLLAWGIDTLMVIGISVLFNLWGWITTSVYWLLRDGCFEGQSIGKRLMGLKVVVGPTHTVCTWKDSFVRNVLWVIPVVNLVMALTGLYALVNDPAGHHWGDRLALTSVVDA